MAVAVLAFCLLRTVVAAWYAGVDASSPVRLVTRNSVSLMFPLPLAYLPRIQAVPGIARVAYAYWFEGVYIDKRHFFPQFAASLPAYLDAYPEFLIPEAQKLALIQDRRGAVAGRKLAARYGWRLGDAIVLTGTYFPGEYRLVLRAIYTGPIPQHRRDPALFSLGLPQRDPEENRPGPGRQGGLVPGPGGPARPGRPGLRRHRRRL